MIRPVVVALLTASVLLSGCSEVFYDPRPSEGPFQDCYDADGYWKVKESRTERVNENFTQKVTTYVCIKGAEVLFEFEVHGHPRYVPEDQQPIEDGDA